MTMEGSAKIKLNEKFPRKEVFEDAEMVASTDEDGDTASREDTVKEKKVLSQRVYRRPDGTIILAEVVKFTLGTKGETEQIVVLESDGQGQFWSLSDQAGDSHGLRDELSPDAYEFYLDKAKRLVRDYGEAENGLSEAAEGENE